MRARCPDTGPPRLKNVEAVAAVNHHGNESRRQPDPAGENPRLLSRRQAHTYSIGLTGVEKALSRQDWSWLRQVAERRTI
jgi:hypothetical protein